MENEREAAKKRKIVRTSEVIAPAYHGLWRDVRAGRHREYWLRGGRGSGKSSFISAAILFGMLKHPNASAMIYRRVAATLRESVYEQMVWAIERFALRSCFELRLTPLEIRCIPTGQRILFRGADNPGKSKSIKLAKGYFGYLWFEELAEFGGMEAIRSLRASVLRGGDPGITFCSYNPPPSAQSWVNAEALLPREGRLVHSSSYLDLPEAWLGDAFLAEAELLRAEDGRAYRHMYLGEATGSGGGVFENLRLRTIPQEQIDRFGAVYSGLDFGWFPDHRYVQYGYASLASLFDFTWIPRYGTNDGTLEGSVRPSYACDLWQYTSAGKIDGISGNVDMNVITGSGRTLEWFLGGD